MRKLILIIIINILTWSSISHASDKLSNTLLQQGYTPIQLSFNRLGHYTVPITINQTSQRLLLDSGASTSVIDKAFIEKYNLPTHKSNIQVIGVGGTQGYLRLVDIDELIMGGKEIKHEKVKVMSMDHVNTAYQKKGVPHVSGLLGSDFLRRTKAIIDYNTSTLWIQIEE